MEYLLFCAVAGLIVLVCWFPEKELVAIAAIVGLIMSAGHLGMTIKAERAAKTTQSAAVCP